MTAVLVILGGVATVALLAMFVALGVAIGVGKMVDAFSKGFGAPTKRRKRRR